MINRRILAAVLLCIGASWAPAADWPRWRGPDGDNVAKDEKGLLKQWPEGGPRLAWEMDIEGGTRTHRSSSSGAASTRWPTRAPREAR